MTCKHPDELRRAATDLRCPLCMEAEIERLRAELHQTICERDERDGKFQLACLEATRLRERVADAETDTARLHKLATDRWQALLELRCRDDRNGSPPPAYRKIIDAALEQRAERPIKNGFHTVDNCPTCGGPCDYRPRHT